MARNPEAVFRAAVERYLPDTVYRQSMGSMYANGTPDRYYEGPAGVLWAEYKYAATLPRELNLNDKLSALQARWLDRAERNSVPVCVILGWGSNYGSLFVSGAWHQTYAREILQSTTLSRPELALAIARFTIGDAK